MTKYFDDIYSAGEACGQDTKAILELIADRYIAENPPHSFVMHSYRRKGFRYEADGRYRLDMNEKYPEAISGSIGIAEAKFWQEKARMEYFAVNCFGPVKIAMDGEKIFCSGVEEEVNREVRRKIPVMCERGFHTITVRMQKTTSGFGCLFGMNDSKWRGKPFFSNVVGEEGQMGFRYRLENGGQWLPDGYWEEVSAEKYPAERIYGLAENKYIYEGTGICFRNGNGTQKLQISCGVDTELALYVDGRLVQCIAAEGEPWKREIPIVCRNKESLLVIRGRHTSAGENWGWRLKESEQYELRLPFAVEGTTEHSLYVGPFNSPAEEAVRKFSPEKIWREADSTFYYELDEPETTIRPSLENLLFARWNYPLGVTLYGMMRTARYLRDNHILQYVRKHIDTCVSFYEYSLWDQETYGYAEINAQLLNISMLDDCGSFANAMLEYQFGEQNSENTVEVKKIADRIASYITTVQERQPDGAFYRICKGNFMENTLWADDLYMSVPFLCRYTQMTGEMSYIHDAAKQLLLFRKYLYMKEKNLMSHVYDFKYHTMTAMPWGRGNGWVFFSLSEILAALPEEDENREQLVEFFRLLADGYMDRQLENGMWPQLLDYSESYPEASCTAMFVYGLCRGLRYGWLSDSQRERAEKCARNGWKALTDIAIDSRGNVYGVCEGSAYSFKPEYYTEELGWVLNDPHGTGIVMLAGMELQLLDDREAEKR